MSVSARAKVSFTVDIKLGGGAWGKDCTVGQVHKQSIDAVQNRISRLCQENPDIFPHNDMKVTMITSELQ